MRQALWNKIRHEKALRILSGVLLFCCKNKSRQQPLSGLVGRWIIPVFSDPVLYGFQ